MNFLKLRSLTCLVLVLFFISGCKKQGNQDDANRPATFISSIFPNEAGKDEVVTIKGQSLMPANGKVKITINSIELEVVSSTNDSIQVRIPKMLGSGKVMLLINGEELEGPQFFYKYRATVTTIAGTGAIGRADGTSAKASFYCPWGIASDKEGNLYVADSYNRLVRKISMKENKVSSIEIPVNMDGRLFFSPYNIAVDQNTSTLYVTDFNSHVLRVSASKKFDVIYDSVAVTAGIAVGGDGYIYVSDYRKGTIFKMTSDGANLTKITTGLSTPRNLVVDHSGKMYVSAYDLPSNSSAVYQIDPSGTAKMLASDNQFEGFEIALDALGNIYEADHFTNSIRIIEKNGRSVKIAGSGQAADRDGTGLASSFNGPQGLTIDHNGILYVSTFNYDTSEGNKIRKIVVE